MAPTHVRKRVWQRQQRLRTLGFENYRSYLLSGTWNQIKARYRASDLPQACMCGEKEVHHHHVTYERVGGDERLDDLMPLCETCHRIVHVLERRGDIALTLEGLDDPERAAEYRRAALAVAIQGQALREAFHELPIPERFVRLHRANLSHNNVIKTEMRPLVHQFSKCVQAGSISPGQEAWFDQRLRAIEGILTTKRPDALGDLGDTPRSSTDLPQPGPECDGSYDCPCVSCRTVVAQRVAQGQSSEGPRKPSWARRLPHAA